MIVKINGVPLVDGIGEISQFVHIVRTDGLYMALFHESFGQSLERMFHAFVDYSFGIGLLAIVILLIFRMFGSQWAAKGVYLTFAIYVVLQILGAVV